MAHCDVFHLRVALAETNAQGTGARGDCASGSRSVVIVLVSVEA
eukprot:COSAG02_NODE_3400_length_6806_cov_4.811242_1_plen_44_part_00